MTGFDVKGGHMKDVDEDQCQRAALRRRANGYVFARYDINAEYPHGECWLKSGADLHLNSRLDKRYETCWYFDPNIQRPSLPEDDYTM